MTRIAYHFWEGWSNTQQAIILDQWRHLELMEPLWLTRFKTFYLGKIQHGGRGGRFGSVHSPSRQKHYTKQYHQRQGTVVTFLKKCARTNFLEKFKAHLDEMSTATTVFYIFGNFQFCIFYCLQSPGNGRYSLSQDKRLSCIKGLPRGLPNSYVPLRCSNVSWRIQYGSSLAALTTFRKHYFKKWDDMAQRKRSRFPLRCSGFESRHLTPDRFWRN